MIVYIYIYIYIYIYTSLNRVFERSANIIARFCEDLGSLGCYVLHRLKHVSKGCHTGCQNQNKCLFLSRLHGLIGLCFRWPCPLPRSVRQAQRDVFMQIGLPVLREVPNRTTNVAFAGSLPFQGEYRLPNGVCSPSCLLGEELYYITYISGRCVCHGAVWTGRNQQETEHLESALLRAMLRCPAR